MRARSRPLVGALDIATVVVLFGAWFAACHVPARSALVERDRLVNEIICAHSKLDLEATVSAALKRGCAFTSPPEIPTSHLWLAATTAFCIAAVLLWISGRRGYLRGSLFGPRIRLGAVVAGSLLAAILAVVHHRAQASFVDQTGVDKQLEMICKNIEKDRVKTERLADEACRKLGLHLSECLAMDPDGKAQYERYRVLQFSSALEKAQIDAGELSCAEPSPDLVEQVQEGITFGRAVAVANDQQPARAPIDAAPDSAVAAERAGSPAGGTIPADAGVLDAGVKLADCATLCRSPATCQGDTCVPPAPGTPAAARTTSAWEDLLIVGVFGFDGLLVKLLLAGGDGDNPQHTSENAQQLIDDAQIAQANPRDPAVAPKLAEGARRTGQLREWKDKLSGTPDGDTLNKQFDCIEAIKASKADKLCEVTTVSELSAQLFVVDKCKLDYGAPSGRYLLGWVVKCRCKAARSFDEIPTDHIACEGTL